MSADGCGMHLKEKLEERKEESSVPCQAVLEEYQQQSNHESKAVPHDNTEKTYFW